MTLLTALLPLLLAADPVKPAPAAEDRREQEHVTTDGGAVPVVAPKLTPAVGPLLAPETMADGGIVSDAGVPTAIVKPSLSVYNVDLPSETAITLGTFGVYFMADILIKPTLRGNLYCQPPSGTGQCPISDLSRLDRYAVGKNSKEWSVFSDVGMVAALIAPAVYLGLESLALPTRTPWRDFSDDMIVIAESLALTSAMEVILKFSFHRPRPQRYLLDSPSSSFDDELSLPSGHATMTTAATTALTTTIFLRHPDSPVRYLALAGGIILSATVSWARVESGHHFPTDVITGMLIGGFSGFVVPWLHRKHLPLRPTVSFNPTDGATMFSVSGEL